MRELLKHDADVNVRDKEGFTPLHAAAAAMKGDRENCLASGMDGYVSKPVDVSELYRALDQCAHVDRGVRGVGLAHPVPALDRTARHFTVDAPQTV